MIFGKEAEMPGKSKRLTRDIVMSVVTIVVVPGGPLLVAGYWIKRYRGSRSKKVKEIDHGSIQKRKRS